MTKVIYTQNGLDVTWYVMNKVTLPMSERFFEVEVREIRVR